MEKILESLKWLVTLSQKQILILTITAIISGGGYYIYKQEQDIKILNGRIDSGNSRHSTDINILQAALDSCNAQRYRDVEKQAVYWREKLERAEEKASTNHRNIQEIKNNQ